LYQTEDTFPIVVKWIKVKMVPKERDMKELVTPEDIRKLIEVCHSVRDKALIAVGYDSAARIEELLTLTYENIKEEKGYYKITVIGKTGTRTIQLLYSSEFLRQLLSIVIGVWL